VVDLNPLHYVNKFNHMFGDSIASGLEFLGISDPAVDPDGVREIAKKWRHLAKGLDDAASAAGLALSDVEWEGKAAKAFHKRSKNARKHATQMADSLRDGAKALDDFADKAHEMLSEIGVMLAEIAEFEIAGLALSVLTAGASEVASNLMAGERALKVVALVARIEEEGTVLGSVIRGLLEVIRGVERALKVLKEIRGVASVAKMVKEGAKFSAFETLLKDPGAFKDPSKLAGILTEGALMGVGLGVLSKALGKGLKALKPGDLAKLSKLFKCNRATFERLKLRPGFNKLPASIRNMIKKFVRDPIDVATGDMALPRVDVELPGVLPLVLERTHISSYRYGGWFGPTWASTLDQRVQADDDGFVYAAADGARLCFPAPDPKTGEAVGPETPGSRLTLSWDDETDGAVRITDPDTGLIQVFHSPVATADDAAVDLPLQHIQDRNGNRITLVYDEGDIPGAIVHSGGYRIALDRHPSLSRITGLRLTDPAAPQAPGTTLLTFGYDEAGHLTEETNSSGLPMRYTYDADGRITSWTDRNATTYWYAYDDQGRVVATGGTGDALASTLVYDDATRTTTVTDSLGHTRVYQHNEALRLIREIDPLGHVTEQEWNEDLQLIAVTDPLGQVVQYTHDELGRVTRVVRPEGTELTTEYNELGLPTLMVDPDGSQWVQEYDGSGNPVAVTDPAGRTTNFAYDGTGGLRRITDALGHSTLLRNDKAGMPVEVTDALGAVRACERDAFGRPIILTDPLGARTSLEWTSEGKLARRTSADESEETWLYDGEGNCTSHTDAIGGTTLYEYTHFDLLTARTGPDGVRYEFEHDTELQLRKVTNPQGLTWTYIYDPAGRLASETDFDGRTLTYTHDAAGQLSASTNALGQSVTYTHDALGQVLTKNVDGAVTTYAYDPVGRLLQATGPDATVTYSRDQLGRVEMETCNGRTITFTYDSVGNRTSRTTPSGATSTWTYDATGRPTALTTADRTLTTSGRTISFSHDLAGRELARHLSDALTLSSTFDALGHLTEQQLTGPDDRLLQHRAYTYRADGNLTGIDDRHSGARRFDLDVAGRVTAVHAAGWTERYAYDAAGNQTQASWPDTMPGREARGSRTYAGTRVLSAGSVRYEHDTAGRVTLRQKSRLSRKPDTWRYTWDSEDRLTQVSTPDGTTWRYQYDPLGRRIAKQHLAPDGETVTEQTDFTWEGATLVEQTTHTPGTVQPSAVSITWDHDGLRPLAQTERRQLTDTEVDERFYAIVTDLVGTPTELFDENGDIAWRARTTLWGTTVWNRGATAHTPLRFPGQYHDPETGLHYNFFRHYDPETARYASQDPLGLVPAPNPVGYVPNPYTWSDPLGLMSCRPANSPAYSVAFEARLQRNADYPGRSDGHHFAVGNRQLHEAFESDPSFASSMDQLYPGIVNKVRPGPRGGFHRGAPHKLLTWHHEANREGVLQLIPREHHRAPGPVQASLHPGQRGGMETWGGGR
jgi:RHS repeat-associated protein